MDVIINQPFTQVDTIATWSFFNNDTLNANAITPFLAEQTSPGVFTIVGLGTTRTNAGTGIQTFAFGLVGGSAAVGPNIYFGYHGGTTSDAQQGVVELDGSGGVDTVFVFTEQATVGVGETRTGGGFTTRLYSVQASTTTSAAAPEPMTLTLLALGALCLRRRK